MAVSALTDPESLNSQTGLKLFFVRAARGTRRAKEKIKRDKDGYVLGADDKPVPVVLQYSSFDFLNDKAKAIVETHATEAAKRWNAPPP